MSDEKVKCPICGTESYSQSQGSRLMDFYSCPVCGRYEISSIEDGFDFDKNHLSSYLLYHCYNRGNVTEYRYNTALAKEDCDNYKREFQNGHNVCGLPVHMDSDMVEAWYPSTFSERIDNILLYINSRAPHLGQWVKLTAAEVMGMLFVDRYEVSYNSSFQRYENTERKLNDVLEEVRYMLDYLTDAKYIECVVAATTSDISSIKLTPTGYRRVDELQKNSSFGRSVLVAMKFGDDTLALRGAIRKGITEAGYISVFIDEVQHNDFITPELLKYIKDSKFVVVDLTHQNNGAYFEEGYAMGLNKQVVQLCKKSVQLHFDIAQKNTIFWENEDEISMRLTNRIKATID